MNIFLGEQEHFAASTITAIVPARAGSKGLPDKNVIELGGISLVEHSIRLALAIKEFDHVVVTTDSPRILALHECYPDVIFLPRPGDISSDSSSLIDAVIHAFDSICLETGQSPAFAILQPTSPFRSPKDVSSALCFAAQLNVSSMVSVVKMSQNPSECIKIVGDAWRFLEPPPRGSTRRQDYLDAYFITGSFYYATLNRVKSKLYNCFSDSSLWLTSDLIAIDIDTRDDFDIAAALFDFMTIRGYTFLSNDWKVS